MNVPPEVYASSLSASGGYVGGIISFLPFFVRALLVVVLVVAIIGIAFRVSAIIKGEGTVADYIGVVLVAVLLFLVLQVGLAEFIRGY